MPDAQLRALPSHREGCFTLFLRQVPALSLRNTPATYHNGAGGISFADGHSEIHKWRGAATKIPVVYLSSQPAVPFGNDAGSKADYQYLALDHNAAPY